jgi:sec-independent protein translocase protein TatA
MPGPQELLILLVVVLVLFGGSKLPKLARSLGEAQQELKRGQTDPLVDDEVVVERPVGRP